MSKKDKKKEVGRPEIEINIENIKKLCRLHCTAEEIAGYFEISIDTLARTIQDFGYNNFPEFFSRFSSGGKISLRRKQYEVAMQGNTTMLSKLGDAWLGQNEKNEPKVSVVNNSESLDSQIDSIRKGLGEFTKHTQESLINTLEALIKIKQNEIISSQSVLTQRSNEELDKKINAIEQFLEFKK